MQVFVDGTSKPIFARGSAALRFEQFEGVTTNL
jgi:hypothetical protein